MRYLNRKNVKLGSRDNLIFCLKVNIVLRYFSTRCLFAYVMISETANLFLKAFTYVDCVNKYFNLGWWVFKNDFNFSPS